MRTSPYSKDLRQKVIEYINKGKSQQEASEAFGLHRNTVNRWRVRHKKEGHYEARPRMGREGKIDYQALEGFVIDNPDMKLLDIGNKFKISAFHTGRILKKLGFSYKKKPSPMWRRI